MNNEGRAMARRIRVGVIFGGRSGEHEVSLASARSVMNAMDESKYEIVPIGITKEGRWIASSGGPGGVRMAELDVVFPVLHGTFGEDGTVQGLLELAGIPYVGAGVLGSVLGLDKIAFKDVMRAHGLPIVDDVVLKRKEWDADPDGVMDRVEAELDYPVFVKPANLGSSVGISKCHDREELARGLAEAARYDRKLLVEVAVPAAREIEVSVLGNDEPIASVPGEIIPSREFYSYESKYIDDGDEASKLLIPAPISPEMTARVRDLAVRVYEAIDCNGMARADFLLSGETGELYISEVNTIPGFTSISMYPKLWEASGLAYPELIDRLIELALERHRDKQRSETCYQPQSMTNEQ
jgi:D-alanine-D-alanine ligase